MTMRRALLVLAGCAVASLVVTGCAGTGADDTTGSGDLSEQDGLEVGTAAPDFRLKNQDQETIALSDYKGTKNVILVFYPADFTPV